MTDDKVAASYLVRIVVRGDYQVPTNGQLEDAIREAFNEGMINETIYDKVTVKSERLDK